MEREQANVLCADDRQVALTLNAEQYELGHEEGDPIDDAHAHSLESPLTCQCCFTTTTFEETCTCRDGHVVCARCVERFVQELLFGQQQTSLGDDGLACFAAMSESSPCDSSIPLRLMESRIDARLFEQLLQLVQERELQAAGCRVVRCAHCRNAYYSSEERASWWRRPHQMVLAVTLLFLATMFLVCREDRDDFQPLAIALCAIGAATILSWRHTTFHVSGEQPKSFDRRFPAGATSFQCDECHMGTCLECAAPFEPFHRCRTTGGDAEEQLRLVVERAMSAAVIRVCPRCQVCDGAGWQRGSMYITVPQSSSPYFPHRTPCLHRRQTSSRRMAAISWFASVGPSCAIFVAWISPRRAMPIFASIFARVCVRVECDRVQSCRSP